MRRWVIWCMSGEAAGIALVALAYALVERKVLVGPLPILFGGLCEGLCLGFAQARGLMPSGVPALRLVIATAAAAVLGYGLSILGGAGQAADAGGGDPPLVLVLGGGAAFGLVMGALLGAAQAVAARGALPFSPWILRTAWGWALGMAVILTAATFIPATWPLVAVAGLGLAAGAAAGLAIGLTTAGAVPHLALTK